MAGCFSDTKLSLRLCASAPSRLCVKPVLVRLPGSMIADRDFVIEPGAGMRPVIPGRARGDVQQVGGLFDRKADEISQLDKFCLDRVLRGELIERLIDR